MATQPPASFDFEGSLYVEVFKIYEEMFCCVVGKKFQAYRKARPQLPASPSNKAELALQVGSLDFPSLYHYPPVV